jgi:hypothetical protein
MTGQCGRKQEEFTANKNSRSLNSIVEKFSNSSNNNDGSTCTVTPESLGDYILDFGKKLLTNAGLFGIIFIILFVRQNYFDPKSVPSVLTFVAVVSAAFAIMQYLYPDMNGFIIAGIGVSVGMAMFKDQFSTVFINNSSAKLS